jgi:hypothetical protein
VSKPKKPAQTPEEFDAKYAPRESLPTRKKPVRGIPEGQRRMVDPLQKEAGRKPAKRASSALDGKCLACAWNSQYQQHTCHLAPMTAEERAVVEAAMAYMAYMMARSADRGWDQWCALADACGALRAARSGR